MSQFNQIFRKIIRDNRQTKLAKAFKKIANNFLIAYYNEDYFDMENNGEIFLLQSLQKHFLSQKIVVFDVGANLGEWSIAVKKNLNNNCVYCFEIVPKTFELLSSNLSNYHDFKLNNFGLSDSVKTVTVTYYPSENSGSSIECLPWNIESEQVNCHVITGDIYVKRESIERIDLLKIDTEGHDFSVLKGFSQFLATNSIKVIQFEYGKTYIPSRTTLGDIYNLLAPNGYSIGRLYPKGVDFKEYDFFQDEHYRMGNYVAVHQSLNSIIDDISLRS
ncbi:MAG: FkbM family methyltransferase [Xenococcaceae cyanobacterium]